MNSKEVKRIADILSGYCDRAECPWPADLGELASRLRAAAEGDEACPRCGTGEPGETIAITQCPCCGAELDIHHGEDEPGQFSVVGTTKRKDDRHYIYDRAELCNMLSLAEEQRDAALAKLELAREESEDWQRRYESTRDNWHHDVARLRGEHEITLKNLRAEESRRSMAENAHNCALAKIAELETERDGAMARVTELARERDGALSILAVAQDERDIARNIAAENTGSTRCNGGAYWQGVHEKALRTITPLKVELKEARAKAASSEAQLKAVREWITERRTLWGGSFAEAAHSLLSTMNATSATNDTSPRGPKEKPKEPTDTRRSRT